MTEADANKLIATLVAGITFLACISGYKAYKDTVVFNDNHPYLASGSFNNTDGGNTEVDLRLFARDSPNRCIKIYDNTNNPISFHQLPIAPQMDLVRAHRHEIDLNLQKMSVAKPSKVTLCYPQTPQF